MALLLVLFAGTAAARADDVLLGTSPRPTTVAAAHGVVAWSTYEAGRYWLTASIDGVVGRLPVASRGVPFDVDVGDVGGQPAITYSRCSVEPVAQIRGPFPEWSNGRGCRPWAYLTGSGRETRLATGVRWPRRASVVLPSAAGENVAFVLHVHALGHGPHVYRVGKDRRLRRLPESRLGMLGRMAAPTDVDVDATGHVATIWDGLVSKSCPALDPRVTGAYGEIDELHLLTASSDRRLLRTCSRTGPLVLNGLTWDGTTASFGAIGEGAGNRLLRLSLTGRSLSPEPLPPASIWAAADGPATYAVVSHDGRYDVVAVSAS